MTHPWQASSFLPLLKVQILLYSEKFTAINLIITTQLVHAEKYLLHIRHLSDDYSNACHLLLICHCISLDACCLLLSCCLILWLWLFVCGSKFGKQLEMCLTVSRHIMPWPLFSPKLDKYDSESQQPPALPRCPIFPCVTCVSLCMFVSYPFTPLVFSSLL